MIYKQSKKIAEYILLAIIFLVPLFFSWEFFSFNAFTLPKVFLFRTLLLLSLFFFLVSFFGFEKRFFGNKKIFIFLFFLFVSFSFSAYFSSSPDLAFLGRYSRQQGFFTLVCYLIFFLLTVFLFSKGKQYKKIIWVIITSSFLVSLYGCAQYLGWDFFSWSESPRGGRIFSSLGQPNFLGHFLALTLPFVFYVLLFLAKKIKLRIIFSFLFLIQLVALILTFSRSAWLALILATGVGLGCFLFIQGRKKTLIIGFFILLFLVFLFIFWGLGNQGKSSNLREENGLSPKFYSRALNLTNFDQGSGKMRVYYWSSAWQEFKRASLKRKIFGYGPDSLDKVFVKYYTPDWGVQESLNTYPNRAHNLFLDILLHFGVLGLLAFTSFVFYLLYQALAYLKNNIQAKGEEFWLLFFLLISLLIYFFNNLFSFSNVTTYVYFYLLLALLFILSFKDTERKELGVSFSFFSQFLVLLFMFICFGIFIFFYNINPLRADFYYFEARREAATSGGQCSQVLNNIKKSLNLNPGSGFYKKEYLRYGLNCYYKLEVREQREQLKDNLLKQINSLDRQTWDYELQLFTGRVYSLLSRENPEYYPQAENIYKDLINLSPYISTPYKELARLKLQEGRIEEAQKYINKGLDIIPSPQNKDLNQEHKQEIMGEVEHFKQIEKIIERKK